MPKVVKLQKQASRTWEEVLDDFLFQKKAEGKAERTIKDYRVRLSKFFQAYPDAWGDYEALRAAVRRYFAGLADKAPATYNLPLEYLRAFFNWCISEGILAANPTAGLHKRKDEGRARDIPPDVLEKLLGLPNRKTYTGIRDYALILLQLDCGLRPGEALRLVPSDFNLRACQVTVSREKAKTRVSRTLTFSLTTAKAIRRLLEVRPDDWDDTVPVFANQDGQPMLVNSWSARVRKYARKVGYPLTPYSLRHSSAIMFLRGGGHVYALQRMLGHAGLTMTKRYLALTENDLAEQHAVASPVKQLLPERTRVRRVKK
ncbi:Site-specific recombinase XerD [Desulfofundulus australicus DSM 11792]|uniref:Site-specific recombinase XerD n=1 Tax=Desulfofundulus australicus DSM 11792 TaxID=1121425 RepID=A0A1M5DRC4_9FIRM|nr:tyrosine-type recombinase/integrase [Desulfofundulus australicus]SHF69529.1 Site-specific recombinase XerD [Desulfofundulus australicus DSM 11792]